MRYIIPSLGRPTLQKTLGNLPAPMLEHIELMVIPAEYKEYKRLWSSKVKAVHAWPTHIDMMPKKRKWLALNIDEPFLMMDDDLQLMVWDQVEDRYRSAKDSPRLFMKRMLERLPALYQEGNSMVSLPMKFMAEAYVRQHGLCKHNDIGFVCTGFAPGRAKHVKFNRVFAFTDMTVPMQVLKRHRQSVVYYGLCFSQSSAKALQTTGMNSYRTDLIKQDSALKMLQLHPGVVTDFRVAKDEGGGGIALKKFTRRLLTGVKLEHTETSLYNLSKWLAVYGLNEPPAAYTYEDDEPRESIINTIKRNWKRAGGTL